MAFKPRIIVPNANNRRQKTVNIVTSTAGYQKGQIGTFREDTNCETVQDSGGLVKGLPTICVPGYSGGGGGGGGSYSAKAVTFADNSVHFDSASITASNSPYLSISFWINAQVSVGIGWQAVGAIDFNKAQDQDSYFQFRRDGITQNAVTADVEGASYFGFDNRLQDPLEVPLPDQIWTNVSIGVQTDKTAGQKIAQVYYNDTPVTNLSLDDGEDAFDILLNAATLLIRFNDASPDDPAPPYASVADLWISSEKMDWSITANRRKFRDASGKPVSLGANGEIPTGTAPLVFGSGDRNTFLQPNLGTCGALALTGTLTDASTSPSD